MLVDDGPGAGDGTGQSGRQLRVGVGGPDERQLGGGLLVAQQQFVELFTRQAGAPVAGDPHELLESHLGGVAPIGATGPIDTYMDEDLLRFDIIWAAAGKSNSVFRTEPRPLAEAAGARIITVL